ncbi:hypothetical protein B0H14DRAFT_3677460 [Mycena olivaceomarginata]|nr:hypothetical protein B0H14DRAFT_3677460 [Mycena olivaceomarginata]
MVTASASPRPLPLPLLLPLLLPHPPGRVFVAFFPSPSLSWYAGGAPTWTSTLSTQLGAAGYRRRQLAISLPLPVVVHDRHLPVFPVVILPLPIFLPSSSSSASIDASSSSSPSPFPSPSGPSTETSGGSGNAGGGGKGERKQPLPGLRLFPLAPDLGLAVPPGAGNVRTGADGDNTLRTMGGIPGGVGGVRVLVYVGVGVGVGEDAYRCGDTGNVTEWVGAYEGDARCALVRTANAPAPPAGAGGGSRSGAHWHVAGAGARAGGLGPTRRCGAVLGAGEDQARRGRRTAEEGVPPADGAHPSRPLHSNLTLRNEKKSERCCSCEAKCISTQERRRIMGGKTYIGELEHYGVLYPLLVLELEQALPALGGAPGHRLGGRAVHGPCHYWSIQVLPLPIAAAATISSVHISVCNEGDKRPDDRHSM